MAKHYHSDFYQDNLKKIYCKNCFKEFIVGEELSVHTKKLTCPYCQSDNVGIEAISDDESTENLGMGCLGLYFHRKNDDIYDRCFRCKDRITKENVLHSGACSNCCK